MTTLKKECDASRIAPMSKSPKSARARVKAESQREEKPRMYL